MKIWSEKLRGLSWRLKDKIINKKNMQEIDYSKLPDDFEFVYDDNWDLILPEWYNSDDSSDDSDDENEKLIVKDADWKILQDWDSVIAIKDLNTSVKVKRWEKFKNIKIMEDWLLKCWKIALKPEFFKKS